MPTERRSVAEAALIAKVTKGGPVLPVKGYARLRQGMAGTSHITATSRRKPTGSCCTGLTCRSLQGWRLAMLCYDTQSKATATLAHT